MTMRIALIPPLIESVPPKTYGGTERVVSYLADGLVQNGHAVTIIGTGDSITKARLIPVCDHGLRLNRKGYDTVAYHISQLDEVMLHSDEFDVLHFHNDYLHFPVSRLKNYAHVTTLHGRLDVPGLETVYKRFSDMPLVSISNNQRLALPMALWVATVYHGLPLEQFSMYPDEGKYLAFLGRFSPEKRVDRAVEIARRFGMKLKIAAKVDEKDSDYFEKIRHLLDDPLVENVGEIGEKEKPDFLGNAAALLFPIDWPEPFGLVMIEAMACGTPVIAFSNGSVPEVIDQGITGYIVNTVEGAVDALKKLHLISRTDCRKKCEERFDSRIMVNNYEEVYASIIEMKSKQKNPKVTLY
jgi:glycosyltransferase involved in cell wall biosynthesis